MKALILAAGLGIRLAPITDTIPKSLAAVNGQPILFRQIENLLENGIDDITVVSGYMARLLEREVHDRWPFIKIIESVDYATTNNMYSAYLGMKSIGTDGFIMMNADVFFDPSVIKALLEHKAANAIVTDIGTYYEESMKVISKRERLTEISKTITKEDALGSSIDVYKFGSDGAAAFYDKCREYIEVRQDRRRWSEVALNDILGEVEFKACPLVGRWFEIDNLEDLAAAEKLFGDIV